MVRPNGSHCGGVIVKGGKSNNSGVMEPLFPELLSL